MPTRKGAFTPKERVLIDAMVRTGDQTYSGHKAGYANASGASNALQRPAVQQAITKLQLARLQNEVLPLAVERHLALLRDQKVVGQTLNRAIELAYKYGLGAADDGTRKEPHEMTPAELAEAIDALKRAAADKAKPVLDLEETATPGVFA